MNYRVDIYRLDVLNATYEKVDENITFQNLRFTNALSNLGACIFELDVHDRKASTTNLQRYRNQVAVVREGSIVFWGPITKISGNYSGIDGTILVECYSYLSHLLARNTVLSKVFTQEDQAQIAWTLINDTQALSNGSLAITQGSLPTSVDRDRTYEYSSVGDAIVNLSRVINGFDFSFTPIVNSNGDVTSTQFDVYYPYLGNNRTDLAPLQLGKNVERLAFRTDGEMYNTGIAIGQGLGDQNLTSTLEFGSSQVAYSRREKIYKYSDVSVAATLSEKLNAELSKESVESFQIDVTLSQDLHPTYGEYSLGDIIYLDLELSGSGGYINFNGQARIVQTEVNVDAQGAETVTPRLEIIG